jgi:tRNA-specific 2-thiouridylase
VKAAVLLSGGIDSTVAAFLLIEQGYDVMGLTMVNWDEAVGRKGAQAARWLGIEHRIVDLRQVFLQRVIDPFCAAYAHGLTPNPCVECNRFIKFGELLDLARQEGCDSIATGHYALVELDPTRPRYLLKKGWDSKKDQSYFLYGLKQAQLAQVLFPLGGLLKTEVKALGRQLGMEMADSQESQEICFISGDYRDFLTGRIECRSGAICDAEGRSLGQHRGLAYYTIGQRKGLGISAGKPLYVVALDRERNILCVGEEQDLYSRTLTATENNFIHGELMDATLRVKAKIRYAAPPADAAIKMENGQVKVEFVEPQRAVTPGQSVVFYLDDYVWGGGIIC